MPANCAIYARVSTEKQGSEGTSLATQIAACRAYASQHGYTVTLEAQDAYTGTTVSREGLTRIMDAARSGEVQAVVCFAIDRSSRKLADLLYIKQELKRAGVALLFVREHHEDTPQGDFLFQVQGAIAELDRQNILRRLRDGKAQVARNGHVLNNHMIAYGYIYEPQGKTLAIHEPTAQVVRDIYRWYTHDALSLYGISQRLNALGVPTPKGGQHWRGNTVSNILKNEVYTGRYHWNKRQASSNKATRVLRPRSDWIEVAVPALITDSEYSRAQEITARNKQYSPRNSHLTYTMGGLCYCQLCGRIMTGNSDKRRPEGQPPYRYYRCSRADPMRPCSAKGVNAAVLEGAIWQEVVRQITTPEILRARLLARDRATATDSQIPDTATPLREADNALKAWQREADMILDLYVSSTIDKDVLAARLSTLKASKPPLQAEYERAYKAHVYATAQASQDGTGAIVEALEARVDELRELVPLATPDMQRQFLIDWHITAHVAPDARTMRVMGLLEPVTLDIPRPSRKRKKA